MSYCFGILLKMFYSSLGYAASGDGTHSLIIEDICNLMFVRSWKNITEFCLPFSQLPPMITSFKTLVYFQTRKLTLV